MRAMPPMMSEMVLRISLPFPVYADCARGEQANQCFARKSARNLIALWPQIAQIGLMRIGRIILPTHGAEWPFQPPPDHFDG